MRLLDPVSALLLAGLPLCSPPTNTSSKVKSAFCLCPFGFHQDGDGGTGRAQIIMLVLFHVRQPLLNPPVKAQSNGLTLF